MRVSPDAMFPTPMATRVPDRALGIARLLSRWHADDGRDALELKDRLAALGVRVPADSQMGRRQGFGGMLTTERLIRAFHAILDGRHVDRVVDPWSFDGLLAGALVESGIACEADVVTVQAESLVQAIAPAFNLHVEIAHGWDWLRREDGGIDIIASNLPWNVRYRDNPSRNIALPTERLHDTAQLMMLAAARRLTDHGIAVFSILPAAAYRDSDAFLALLRTADAYVDALLYLPRDAFAPLTYVRGAVAVIRKGTADGTFVATLEGNAERDAIVLQNWRARRAGDGVSLGTLVDLGSFQGIEQLEAADRTQILAARIGLTALRLGDLLTRPPNQTRATEPPGFEEHPDAVYLPKIGRGPALVSPADFRMKPHNYMQLFIDTTQALPSYVANYFSTPIGVSAREAALSGATIPKLTARNAPGIAVYLPDVATQQRLLATAGELSTAVAELREAQERLWAQPGTIAEAEALLQRASREESYTAWLDRLPFPLASILWAHKTAERDDRRGYHHLLQFFEALAEFFASILLSAARRSPDLLGEEGTIAIVETMSSGGVSLRKATFGTWTHLFSFLAKRFRTLIHGRPQDRRRVGDALATHDDGVLALLTSRQLVAVLDRAIQMRNRSWAHVGIIGARDAAQRHEHLRSLLVDVRGIFGVAWDRYELISPRTLRRSDGRYFHTVRRIVGRPQTFEEAEVEFVVPLEENRLHLYSPGEKDALELVPFVKVMPSPKTETNTCYFYNHRAKGELWFVSYHFEQDAEIMVVDDAVSKLIDELTPFTPG